MAYIVSLERGTGTGVGAGPYTGTVNLPTNAADDLILIFSEERFINLSAPANWYNPVSDGDLKLFAHKVTTPLTSVALTADRSGEDYAYIVAVVRDADVSNMASASYVDVSGTRASSSGTTHINPTVTTTSADCLMMSVFGENQHGDRIGFPYPGYSNLGASYVSSKCFVYGFYWGQESAGASGTSEAIPGTYNASHNPNGIVVAIKNATSGSKTHYCDISSEANRPFKFIHCLGVNGGSSGKLGTATVSVDVSSIITTVGGQTTINTSFQDEDLQFTDFHKNSKLETSTSGNVNKPLIRGAELASAQDLSNTVIAISTKVESNNINKHDFPALNIGFLDSVNGYKLWPISGRDCSPNVGRVAAVTLIDVNEGTETEVSGTALDITDVTDVVACFCPSNTFTYGIFSPLVIMQTLKALGGDSANPVSFAKLKTITDNCALFTIQDQQGQSDSQYAVFHNIQIGNGGTNTVYWDSTAQAVSYPKAYSTTSTPIKMQAQIPSAKLSFIVDAGTGKTVNLINQPFDMGNFHNWTLTSGAVDITGAVITNATVTIGGSLDSALGGFFFSNCKTITNPGDCSTGGTFDSSAETYLITISGATQAALQAALDNIANCNLTASNTGIRVEFTGTGNVSLDFNNITWTGNTTDIHYNSTNSSQLTAVMENGSNASTTAISGSATGVTISAPTFDLTVNSDQSASQIHVYTTNTQTTLSTVASGTQLVYTHSSETVDITVLKNGFVPYRQTALALSGNVTVNVQMIESREYDSSHGLTYTTDASIYDSYNIITGITQANPAVVTYSGADNFSNNDIITLQDVIGMTEVNGKRYTVANVDTGANTFELSGINSTGYTAYSSGGIALSGLSVPTFGPSARAVFSLLMEQFKSNSALRNLPFNLEMDGANSLYLINGVEGLANSDITNMTAAGVEYRDIDATITASFTGVESIGTATGFQGEYQQQDGSGTTDARITGNFDEIIQTYGDSAHGNFDYRGHLVLKFQPNGYRESRVDVLSTYGISSLEPTHYVVAMQPEAITAATGDPAITLTITDHGASPVTWNSKNFGITITSNDTGENILRELNYNLSLDATYQGKDPFNWPEMVKELGSAYDTVRGYTEGAQSSTYKGVRVVQTDGTTPNSSFTRFQSDDGTYYTPPVTSSISITSLPNAGASKRLQISNETAKSASAWQATTAYAQGDKVIRSTGLGTENTAGLYYVATTGGTSGGLEPTFPAIVGNTVVDGTVTWTCFAILYYDADPAATSYASNYTDGEEFATGDTYKIRFAELNAATSFKTYETTGIVSSTGFTVAAGVTEDSVYATNAVDGSSASVTNKFTADYANDQIDLDTNSDFAATEAFAYYCYELTTSQGMYQFWGGMTAIDPANYRINTATVSIYFDETAGFVKQTDSARIFRDDDARPAIDPTTGGYGIEINWRNPVYGYDAGGGGFTASDRSDITAIKNKTDSLTFTQAGNVDSNIQYVNDVAVTGTGTELDPWGP